MFGKTLLRVFCASLSVFWALPCAGFELKPDQVSWSRLLYEFEDESSSVTAEVRQSPAPAAGLANLASAAADADVRLLTASIAAKKQVVFFKTKGAWQTQTWFLPEMAAPLKRIRRKFGDTPNIKTYHYAKDQVRRQRAYPKNKKEAKKDSDVWSDIQDSTYALRPGEFDCASMSDTSLLLYVLSAAAITESTAPWRHCFFNKKAIYYVELRAAGVERLQTNYIAKRGESVNKVRGEADALKIQVTAQAANATGQGPEPFEFLKLRGRIDIHLDRDSRLPLQIRGKVPNFGTIELKLSEATFKE